MGKWLLRTIWIGALVGLLHVTGGAKAALSTEPTPAPSGTVSDRPEPCYVVIAVDISGSMENSDAPVPELEGRRQTLRDEGQLIFMQILPFLRSEMYIGVAHFSDKVRYSLPNEQTGPLLPWGQTFLTESACRNMVRPAEFQATYQGDIAESMNWAMNRIAAARRQYGQGPAKLIVLSNGAPRDSARELDRGRGPLLNMAKRLASQQIQMYPILINGASFRSAERQPRLSADEIAAEDLMNSAALLTGGKAYRLAREFGFVDILMDAFGLGMQIRDNLVVSRYDWAIVAVGTAVKSAAMQPAGGPDKSPRGLTMDSGLEAASGIRSNVIASPWYQTTILRRPDTADLVNRFWQGTWTLASADGKAPSTLRVYRIPDFLVQLELDPKLPWWLHEQVQVKAHLLERHKRGPGLPAIHPPEESRKLSIRIKANPADETNALTVDQGRWATPAQLYETDPFTIGTPGLYKLVCELRHGIGDVNVPVLQCVNDLYVHSECVGIKVINAATNETLGEVPPTAGATVGLDLQGGQDVRFVIAGKGEFNVEPLSGVLHLEPLSQTDWPLRKEERGDLAVGPVRLIEQEERLTGWAQLDVRTHAGVRHLRLPKFDLVYPPAPMRIACTFVDPREALWAGEFPRQQVIISAFPVFERFRDETMRRFPETLPQTRIRTVDTRSGTTQVTGPESRVLDLPQAGGHEGTTVSATYFVESSVPVPSAEKCEIDLGPAMENLQGTMKTYAIVDPVAQGLFRWIVAQPGQPAVRPGAVSEMLFCGEPIQFHAEWRADQHVSAVRFEFPQTDSNEPLFVDMPVTAGATQADLEQALMGLSVGQAAPVYVHVTMQPAGAERPLQIKLKGGQFRAEDRRVVLEDLMVGEAVPTDIAAYAWEPVEVPLKAVFAGYTATDPRHNAAIDQFKKSCVVTITGKTGDARNASDTIEWTSVTPAEGPARRCELAGHVTCTPETTGRATVELTAEAPAAPGAAKSAPRRVYAHMLAKSPRLAVAIHKITPSGEESVFDSRRWSAGEGGVSSLLTRFSARLRVDIRPSDWTATGQSQPWRTAVRLLRRPSANADWVSEFSDAGELDAEGSFLREVQITGNGEYALEVAAYDAPSGRRTAFFRTPVIASIQPHEIRPAVAPPAWLTSRVRQWPFEYQVTLHQEAVGVSQPQALAFQFQLPGQGDVWMEGAASSVLSQTSESQQLLVRGPRFLPAVHGLRDGMVQFKLSSQGLDLLRWDCPNIRVIPPVLERLAISHRVNAQAFDLDGAELTLGGSRELWVRPRFRAAPELEGQWVVSESTVYLWPRRDSDPSGGQVDVSVLEGLQAQGGANVRAFKVENATSSAVKVMSRRIHWSFLGWPRRPASERYSLVASVVYRSREGSAAGGDPVGRMIAEWSDVYTVRLNTPWVVPLIWWPILAMLVAGLLAAVLRRLVPSPSRLALDMRLEENIAVVEPVRLDNPVLVDLRETPLTRDMQMYTRYLRSLWGGGPVKQALAAVVAPARVLLRRALYPRRWAWTAVIPRVRGDARSVRTGLLCVWTGLNARSGRVWTCQEGSIPLPQEEQIKTVHLDLPYKVDSVDRTMRVTVRIKRVMSRGS